MEKIIGIYKYINKVNKKVYIGQSRDITHRYYTHKYSAYNEKHHEYNSNLSKAIRKYGLENFKFEILEEITQEQLNLDKNILNTLEKKYIKKYDSYINGYNMTQGGNTFPEISESRAGERNSNAKMTRDQVLEIRKLWATPVKYADAWRIWKDKCPSERCFQKIWHRETWKDVGQGLITDELIKWHRTKAKSVPRNHNNAAHLSGEEVERILLDKKKGYIKSPSKYYRQNKWIQEKITFSGFEKIIYGVK